MGRQSGDPTVVGSSIALLQERFRQLQQVREKREERELLKLLSESERINPIKCFEPAKSSFQPEMKFPSRPPREDALSLGLNLYGKPEDFQTTKTPAIWSTDAAIVSTSHNFEHSDVDTSLHL